MEVLLRRLKYFLLALFVPVCGVSHASSLTNSDILSQFNAVIFGNFSTTSDVGGRTVVGGNLTGGATFDLDPAGAAASSFSALSVYGSATSGGNYNVNDGGGVVIAGSNNVSFTLNGGGTAFVGGTNSGNITVTNGSASVTVGGANSGTLQLASGGSVYVGGTTGNITANGSAAVSINGNNNANVTLNGGGSVALAGSNSGTITLDGGVMKYTGSQNGNLNLNGGASATPVSSLPLAAPTSTLGSLASTFIIPLTALSTQLSSVAANSAVTSSNGTITFNATPNSSGVAVFDIDTSVLAPNSTVTMNLDGATSVIVNVSVDSCVSDNCAFALPNSLNFSDPTGYASTVLWNFVNATNLTFSNEFGGTVLAPLAAVSNSNPIDGTLVAASFSGNGELHDNPYTGTLPGSTVVPAPEPAGVAVIGSGIFGLTLVRLKRRRPVFRRGRRQGCGWFGSFAGFVRG